MQNIYTNRFDCFFIFFICAKDELIFYLLSLLDPEF